jgi:GntR family transcriptional regulator / MocR family aminotransferase
MRDALSGWIDVELRPQSGETLSRQLTNQLRDAILKGLLPPGHRLPSSREFAQQLQISRNTVSSVIDQLAMEGYLDIARGRRPTVAASKPSLMRGNANTRSASAKPLMSQWAERLRKSDWPVSNEGAPRPFLPGLGDAREFPRDLWARCLRRAVRGTPVLATPALNRPALQAALLRHLVEHRGVKAGARQIMILPSAQAAIELVARVMLNAGDLAWLESPGYGGAHAALEAAGARVCGVRLDQNGLSIKGRRDRPRLIFVTPSHQYPTGRLMPVHRRQQLLSFAASVGATIVEDDYDSEFHYDGRPVAALQGLDETGRTIYVGTFSKSTFVDIRVGYIIVPESFVDVFEKAQRHSGQIAAAPVQDALAEFIEDGHFAAHIRKMTRLYRDRRDHLVRALNAVAGDRLTAAAPSGGMQLVAYFTPPCEDRAVSAHLSKMGVTARPLSPHFIGGIAEHGLFLGFAAWNEREIDAGADIIGAVMRRWPAS